MNARGLIRLLAIFLLAAPLVLTGCEGKDGSDGADGQDGVDGIDGMDGQDGQDGAPGDMLVSIVGDEPEELSFMVTGITIASPPVVDFTVTDDVGRGAVGLGEVDSRGRLRWVRFVMAKLVPAVAQSGDADDWVRYTYERSPAGLVDHGDGTYTYTFDEDLGDYDPSIPYEETRTHRLAMQSSGGTWEPVNYTTDFVPDQLPGPSFTLPLTRDVVTTAACDECHTKLHIHGTRYETKYCVTCHNPTLGEGDMTYMVHAIHAAGMRTNDYILDGDDFSGVGYPQDLKHCTKCHKGTDENWKTRPTMESCGACHDWVDFSTTDDHPVTQTNNVACALCHTPDKIMEQHTTDNATANNPQVPAGAVNFTYELAEVTVNASDQAVVKFRILGDGTPIVFDTYAGSGSTLLTGYTRSPGFLLAWALPQSGIDEPTDYNNLGNNAGQPTSVSIEDLWDGSSGTLSGPDAEGYYTGTITSDPFPSGAEMRAVALQGYFSQTGVAARHTISVVQAVTGDDVRRDIVDDAKCGNCHEWFEAHGGNRVYTVQVCATCHVPNLSSSGRTGDLTSYIYGTNSSTDNTIDELGWDPLTYPEDTNSLKDLIHGIHAAHDRDNAFEFVRLRSGNLYYFDFSHVTFPTDANNCMACHESGTYDLESIPGAAFATNTRTTTGNPAETRQDILDVRKTVPNDTDVVNSPISSTCYYCHDTSAAVEHMAQNGAAIRWIRDKIATDMPVETCIVCHGPGRIADVEEVHQDD